MTEATHWEIGAVKITCHLHIDHNHIITEEISLLPTPGHTPCPHSLQETFPESSDFDRIGNVAQNYGHPAKY
jgi:hypothetical protein